MVRDIHVVLIAVVITVLFFSGFFLVSELTETPQKPVNPATPPVPATTPVPPVTVKIVPERPPVLVRLVTTPEINETGLLGYLKPRFDSEYNADLRVTVKETPDAIEAAKQGSADILVLNDPLREMAFLKDGYGLNRRTFAYDSFIIVGPPRDPAGIRGLTPEKAFPALLASGTAGTRGVVFISGGGGSEVHRVEISAWSSTGTPPDELPSPAGGWYVTSGSGMNETLLLADRGGGYTITDNGTYRAAGQGLDLEPLVTGGPLLVNGFSSITVYTEGQPVERIRMANNFTNFLRSPATQKEIGEYADGKDGRPLLVPATNNTVPDTGGYFANETGPAVAIRPLKILYPATNPSVFGKYKNSFEQHHPATDVQLWPGSNAGNIREVGKYGGYSDLLATTSDYLVFDDLYPDDVTFLVTYAQNGMVLAYTNESRGADIINGSNWYRVLETRGVRYATSDPNEEPVGYRAYMVLELAERYYGDPGIFDRIVGAHSNITEVTYKASYRGRWTVNVTDPAPDNTTLFIATSGGASAVQMLNRGTVDYIFTYRSIADRQGLRYVEFPPEIDLSDPMMADRYALVRVIRAPVITIVHVTGTTLNMPGSLVAGEPSGSGEGVVSSGADREAFVPDSDIPEPGIVERDGTLVVIRSTGSRTVTGRPLVYSITMPVSAHNREDAVLFINMVIGSGGQAITISDGQTPIIPAIATGYGIPYILLPDVRVV